MLDFLAGGMSIEEVLAKYPQLEEADIRAAIAYGAERAKEGLLIPPAATG